MDHLKSFAGVKIAEIKSGPLKAFLGFSENDNDRNLLLAEFDER